MTKRSLGFEQLCQKLLRPTRSTKLRSKSDGDVADRQTQEQKRYHLALKQIFSATSIKLRTNQTNLLLVNKLITV